MALSSANGILSLLDDKASEVRGFALKKLFDHADSFWPEISEEIPRIETLYEDASFKHNKLAALLASKVYYHLSEFKESLYYALCAEELFDVNSVNEFVETINSKCIDEYIRIRQKVYTDNSDPKEEFANFDKLEQVVNRMFDKCFEHQQHKQGLGIAVESRRLDMFEKAVETSRDKEDMLQYAFKVALSLIGCKGFRNQILTKLVRLYNSLASPDYVSMCQCLIFLEDFSAMAEVLERLISQGDDSSVIGYQLAFDMYENASQQFMHKVRAALKILPSYVRVCNCSEEEADDKPMRVRYEKLQSILSGEKVIELHLQFLIKNNHSDLKLLDKIKVDVRHSVTHNATVIANGLMHYGTTSDQFLRENLDWLGRAVNWAKFTATSTLGVIHKGHEKEALKLMSAYLPKEGGSSTTASMYTEGGGLYALGLMHANHGGADMTEYLLKQSREATSEPVRHGACLGLGLAAMGTERADVYEQLKSSLYMDDAVTGEAAGLAMGLVMLGGGSAEATNDMLTYAKDTGHEKISRGLALGMALTMYGRQEEADILIETLAGEKCAIMRWAGMATIAMAYCGTGDNAAIRRLLHAAVSDTNDDVRRWAVTALGFVLFKSPEQIPSLVSLLSESYNPHVRYGAAMALGVGCAGTALKEAVAVVEPLLDDSVAFVRQGALVAMAMMLMQQNKVTSPKSADLRDRAFKVVADRHEDLMTKFGAILAMGILDAGGRNVSISLKTRTGNTNMSAAVGLLVFQNHWFWYPLANFVSLAFSPTCVIVLNRELKMPRLEIRSRARPSVFAYPEPTAAEKEKKKEKVETAVLSVTAKQQQKKRVAVASALASSTKNEPVTTEGPPQTAPPPPQPEADFLMLENPARVMAAQLRVIELAQEAGEVGQGRRYTTVKPLEHGGILMARDNQPHRPQDMVETVRPAAHRDDGDEDNDDNDDDAAAPEPEAPEPFLFQEEEDDDNNGGGERGQEPMDTGMDTGTAPPKNDLEDASKPE